MDGAGHRHTPSYRSALTTEMAAAADSKMDLSRNMRVPDKIYVSESHSATPSGPYRSSGSSTPLSAMNSSVVDVSRSGQPSVSGYSETGMNLPRRYMMGETSGLSTPSQPVVSASPAYPEPLPMVAELSGNGRHHGTPMRPSDSHLTLERTGPVFRGAVTHSSSQGSVTEELDALKRRVAELEKQISASSGGADGNNQYCGGLSLALVLAFWVFNPVMFYLWRQTK